MTSRISASSSASIARHEPEPFELAGGEDEGIGGLVVAGQGLVRDEPEEANPLAEAERFTQRLELPSQRARATNQQERLGHVPCEGHHRPDQEVETHPALEVPHAQEQEPLGRETERLPHGGAVLRRAEPRRVRGAGNLDDPIPRNAIELPELVSRVVAQHVDGRRAPQARAFGHPQRAESESSHDAPAMMGGHPAAGAVLEGRRRVKAVKTGQFPHHR